LQGVIGALGDVEDDGSLELIVEFYRVGDDGQGSGVFAQEQAAPLAQALLRGRCEIGDVGLFAWPDGGRDEGAAALFEEQHAGAGVGDLRALQR